MGRGRVYLEHLLRLLGPLRCEGCEVLFWGDILRHHPELVPELPKEGAIAITFGAGMPKRAPNPDGAYVYLNAMLDRKAMAELAAASFYAPANGAAELSPELRARIDFSPEEREHLNFPDYAYVSKNTAEWLEWWNKTMAR